MFLILFLAGFGLVRRVRVKDKRPRPTFAITANQLFYFSVSLFLLGFSFLFLEWRLYSALVTYSNGSPQQRERSAILCLVTAHVYRVHFTHFGHGAHQFRRGIVSVRKSVLMILLAITLVYYFLEGARSNLVWFGLSFLIVWLEVPDRNGSRRLGLKPLSVFSSRLRRSLYSARLGRR